MELLQGKRLQFLILSDSKVVDLALFSRGKFFKNHVTLGIMVNSQKLLGTDDRKRSRYKNERSTVKLK
jgi:hypothetical protein